MTPDKIIPDPETYVQVMQRYDRDTGRVSPRIRLAAGCVNIQSVKAPSMRPNAKEEELAHTLFFPKVSNAYAPGVAQVVIRARRLGWHLVTEQWTKHLEPVSPESDGIDDEGDAAVGGVAVKPEEVVASAPVEEPEDTPEYTIEALSEMPYKELQTLAAKLKVGGKGARVDIESRIFTHLSKEG